MKWTSVKDRMPSMGTDVLACSRNGNVMSVAEWYYASGGSPVWFVREGVQWGEVFTAKVTHWMPLPDPPEAQP